MNKTISYEANTESPFVVKNENGLVSGRYFTLRFARLMNPDAVATEEAKSMHQVNDRG